MTTPPFLSMRLSWLAPVALCVVLGLAGCGKSGPDASETASPELDNTAEVQAYYDAHPDYFSFKTPADLPKDLVWETGMDLPEIGSPHAKKGGTSYWALDDFPRTLRLVGPDSNGSFRPWILDDTRMGMANRHPNDTSITENGFKYYPGIAEAWAVDKSAGTVYVRINPAARWSDGPPITTDDVLFTFFFYRSSYITAPWYNNYFETKFSNVTRYDEYTYSVTFPDIKPDILSRGLSFEPQPKHFYKELGPDYADRYQWRYVPTSGPYVLRNEDIDKGRSITLTRNKDWWAKDNKYWRYRFNPDKIRLSVIRDSAKRLEAFKKGELDFARITTAEIWYDQLPDTSDDVAKGYIRKDTFYNDVPRPSYGLWINSYQPLLNNRDIREGIQFATDWKLVIEKFARGDWTRMKTNSDGYGEFSHPTLQSRPYDLSKATAAFARAGFTKRGPDGILVNAKGQRLSFELACGWDRFRDVLTILREQALKAGLEFRIELSEGTAFWKKMQEKQHDIGFSAFAGRPEMYPRYWETYHSSNAFDDAFLPDGSANPDRKVKTQTNNLEMVANRHLDDLITRYDASGDVNEMKALAFEIEEWLHDYGSFSPAFNIPFLRSATWRWVGIPEDGNVKLATTFEEFNLFWIDEDVKRETLKARQSGRDLGAQILIFDQYKP